MQFAATLLVAAAVGISVSDQISGRSDTGSSIQAVPGTAADQSASKAGAGSAGNPASRPNVVR